MHKNLQIICSLYYSRRSIHFKNIYFVNFKHEHLKIQYRLLFLKIANVFFYLICIDLYIHYDAHIMYTN